MLTLREHIKQKKNYVQGGQFEHADNAFVHIGHYVSNDHEYYGSNDCDKEMEVVAVASIFEP